MTSYASWDARKHRKTRAPALPAPKMNTRRFFSSAVCDRPCQARKSRKHRRTAVMRTKRQSPSRNKTERGKVRKSKRNVRPIKRMLLVEMAFRILHISVYEI